MDHIDTMDGRGARKIASQQKLIATAFQLLATKGVDGITMRGLADEAGMAPATAYNVFGSKAALLEAMLASAAESQPKIDLTSLDGDFVASLITLADQISDEWTNPGSQIVVLLKATVQTGGIASYMSPIVHARTTELCAWLIEKGVVRNEVPAEDLAWRIVYANAGLFDAWLDGRVNDEDLRRHHRLNNLMPIHAMATNAYRDRFLVEIQQAASRPIGH